MNEEERVRKAKELLKDISWADIAIKDYHIDLKKQCYIVNGRTLKSLNNG
jgi:hypothetical protein